MGELISSNILLKRVMFYILINKKFFYKFVFLITRCRHGHNLLGMNSFCLFM